MPFDFSERRAGSASDEAKKASSLAKAGGAVFAAQGAKRGSTTPAPAPRDHASSEG